MSHFPLSHGQQALWFHQQLEPTSSLHNLAFLVKVLSRLDIERLHHVFKMIFGKYESLRTRYVIKDGIPEQFIENNTNLDFIVYDAQKWNKSEFEQHVNAQAKISFDLETENAMRVRVYQQGTDQSFFLLVFHHIAIDLWSIVNLIEDLGKGYTSGRIDPISIKEGSHFKDYVTWHQQYLNSEQGIRLADYWKSQVADKIPPLNFPFYHVRPAVKTHHGSAFQFKIDASLSQQLRKLSRSLGVTLYTLLIASFQSLIYRYTKQEKFLIGSIFSGRTRSKYREIFGFFVNPVIIETRLDEQKLFIEHLRDTEKRLSSLIRNQNYPYSLLVENVISSRDPSRSPLYDIEFVYDRPRRLPAIAPFIMGVEGAKLDLGDLVIESVPLSKTEIERDLQLFISDDENILYCAFNYSTDLFSDRQISSLAKHYITLLGGVLNDPDKCISQLPIITPPESKKIVQEWNNTHIEYPKKSFIFEFVEGQAKQTPEAVAISFENKKLTYQEFDKQTNRLAHFIRKYGVDQDQLVGIYIGRSVEMVLMIHAVLKAGGAYVPLDPELPIERIEFMVDDIIKGGAKLILTTEALSNNLPKHIKNSCLCIDSLQNEIQAQSDLPLRLHLLGKNLAYMIYTSGSTGKPKGVMNTHEAILNRLLWMQDIFKIDSKDRVLQKTPFSFDVSVWEFFWPLMFGAELIITRPGGHRDPDYLAEIICEREITIVHFVPSMLNIFLLNEHICKCTSLKKVICSGESLPLELMRHFFECLSCELHNLYGPTEAAVDVTWWQCSLSSIPHIVPIGFPIANIKMHILDHSLNLVPVGVLGDLYIGGVGLARGYFNKPDLTAERFIPDPFAQDAGARLYKTGDLARYVENGAIEYHGRSDFQVKIRGFRIELEEIQACLEQHPLVRKSIVTVVDHPQLEKCLVVYLTCHKELNQDEFYVLSKELNEFATTKLPDYMLPKRYIPLLAFPLSPSGKIDRLQLPIPELNQISRSNSFIPPLTLTEQAISLIWRKLLGRDRVGREDHFFEIGGHSLLATQMIAQVRKKQGTSTSIRSIFENPTLKSFCSLIEQQTTTARLPEIAKVNRSPTSHHPLSYAQKRLWFLDQLEPESSNYNVSGAVYLDGLLDIGHFKLVASMLEVQHESLRTRFLKNSHGEPYQIIDEPRNNEQMIEVIDLEFLPVAQREKQARLLVESHGQKPFALDLGYLWRILVIKISEQRTIVSLSMHHIVSDGWSIAILMREIGKNYSSAHFTPFSSFQYLDYVYWQKKWFEEQNGIIDQIEYWKEKLKGITLIERLELPLDHPRPRTRMHRGTQLNFHLGEEICQKMANFCLNRGLTPFMFLIGVLKVLLHRLTGSQEIVIGTPIAGRRVSELENMIGFFVNTLALRSELNSNISFEQFLLNHLKQTILEAYENQDVPFERIVEELNPERDMSRSPLFDVMFVLQNAPFEELRLQGVRLQEYKVKKQTAKFDLLLEIETTNPVKGFVEYNTDLFDSETINRIIEYYKFLVQQIIENPCSKISEYKLMSFSEEEKILVDLNRTKNVLPTNALVHEMFEDQAKKNPQNIAIKMGSRFLTYQELNQKANQLCHKILRQAKNRSEIGPIAIYMIRSPEMLIGIIVGWKLGVGYLPLDETMPEDRVCEILQDAKPSVVLTNSAEKTYESIAGMNFIIIDLHNPAITLKLDEENNTNPGLDVKGDDIAYIIYTSGSTGKPKGVMVPHLALQNLCFALQWAIPEYKTISSLKFSLNAPIFFDSSVKQIIALTFGHSLEMIPNEVRTDPPEFVHLIRSTGIDVLDCTPGILELLISAEFFKTKTPRIMLIGGEEISINLWSFLSNQTQVKAYNVYGPTECTVDSTISYIGSNYSSPVLGCPLANIRIHILDQNLHPVPPGVRGEICITGRGLARGYMNAPELTAEKFVPNPFPETRGERLYRTGDMGRYLRDGSIEYLGRSDHQVKIRGNRIELGDIESVLRSQVKQAVVVPFIDQRGEKKIVAYVVGEADFRELREFLKTKLPEYMIPPIFMRLESIPLTINGKINRKQLPTPTTENYLKSSYFEPPVTPIELQLSDIWCEILSIQQIGLEDHFFEVGGHSLLVTQLVTRVQNTLGIDLKVKEVFETPRFKDLALLLQNKHKNEITHLKPVPRTSAVPASFAQQRMWFLNQLNQDGSNYNMIGALRIEGPFDIGLMRRVFEELIRRHEVLRTTFLEESGVLKQVISPHTQVKFAILAPPVSRSSEMHQQWIQEEIQSESCRKFDLSQGPLLFIKFLRLNEQESILIVNMHHIISDGWSISIFVREVGFIWNAFSQNQPLLLPELKIQYADFAEWQRKLLKGNLVDSQLKYWKKQLISHHGILNLPTDRERVKTTLQMDRAGSLPVLLNDTLVHAIQEVSSRSQTTVFMTLLTAFGILLSRHSGDEDIIIGSPVANRQHPELEHLIGFFVNTLALRLDLSGNPTFNELLAQVRKTTLDAYTNQDVPFEQVLEIINPLREQNRQPLFQTMFILQTAPIESIELRGLKIEPVRVNLEHIKFDLLLNLSPRPYGIEGTLEYNASIFERSRMERMISQYTILIENIIQNPNEKISMLSIEDKITGSLNDVKSFLKKLIKPKTAFTGNEK